MHKVYGPQALPDRMMYLGRFRGYRMKAFGREQILDYEAEILVYQARHNPPLWVARDRAGKMDPAFQSFRAEDTLRLVAEGFTTCVAKWETYEDAGLLGVVKLGPKLVPKPAKSA
jgi:hypothetical protein